MSDQDLHKLLAEIAHLYYVQGMTQKEIADRLGKYTPTHIGRLLKKAKEEKIVNIQVLSPRAADIEIKLKTKFEASGLIEVRIAPSHEEYAVVRSNIGRVAAEYFDEIVKNGKSVAVSDGYYIYEMTKALEVRERDIRIYPLELIGRNLELTSISAICIVHLLWHKSKGKARAYGFCLPTVEGSLSKAQELMMHMLEQPHIKSIYEGASDADFIFTNLGHYHKDCLRAEILSRLGISFDHLKKGQALGFLGWTLFDSNGVSLINQRHHSELLTIPLEQYKKTAARPDKCVVMITSERTTRKDVSRLAALKTLLRLGFINVLITDEETGEKLL